MMANHARTTCTDQAALLTILHVLSEQQHSAADTASASAALHDPEIRRALRRALPSLPPDQAAAVARQLLAWREDFMTTQRDFSTWYVVSSLDRETLLANADWLLASNAALALWERTAADPAHLRIITARAVQHDVPSVRETALVLLFLEPATPFRLPQEDAEQLLVQALDDSDPALRGLAATIAQEYAPALLVSRLEQGLIDAESQGMRAACWALTFLLDTERAREQAASLLGDRDAPVSVRVSALEALALHLTTAEIAPILAMLVNDPCQFVAEAAAEILWQLHRHPLPAQAALTSPYPAVRAIGQRLLDPRRGSPAAGGSRPGAPV